MLVSPEWRIDGYNDIKESINLVEDNLITSVKNQGKCDASYAFGLVAALEMTMIKEIDFFSTEEPDLSEQQLINCAHDAG